MALAGRQRRVEQLDAPLRLDPDLIHAQDRGQGAVGTGGGKLIGQLLQNTTESPPTQPMLAVAEIGQGAAHRSKKRFPRQIGLLARA